MKLKRILTPIILLVVVLVQFFPAASLGPQRAAALTYCDWAQFIADVTIPDGTNMAPSTTFTKTWRLKNIGTCTWTTSYALVFSSGDSLGATTSVAMPTTVAPGATVDLTVNMTAPASAGHYRGYWKLRNASSVQFGIGSTAASAFWVDIYVTSSSGGTGYDFVANYCSATWSSGAGVLPCPGTDGSASGYVIKQDAPKLETGSLDTAPGLLVAPQNVAGGYITGVYPAFTVQSGDRFQSIVNCAYGATSCYVNFRLQYKIGAGPVQTLWSFKERYEGLYYRVNLDLSSLAGQNVTFILYMADVNGYGVPSGDKALWGAPKIVRSGSVIVTPVPTLPPSGTLCDRAYFIADVTIADGTFIAAGTPFTKTWRLKNVGTCTWTTAYSIYFASGDSMGSPAYVTLPSNVAPGQMVNISVPMVAPGSAGHYRGYWLLRNASAGSFGIGSSYNYPFWVDINVTGSSGPTNTPGPSPTPGPSSTPVPTATGIILGPSAELYVTITDSLGVYTPGGTATYTLLVHNSGPNDVIGANLLINKPVQITSWTVTCVHDTGATCTAGPITTAGNITDLVNIPVGKNLTYTVASAISASAVGNMVTTATITNPAATPDPNLANNSASDTDAPPSADLSITKTDGISMWTPGGTSTYTIVVRNNGPLNVTGATFSDAKPAQVTSWTWICTPDAGATCGAGSGGSIATNITDVTSIPAGKKVTYTVVATLTTAIPGNLVNTATITNPIGTPDPILANNTATDTDNGPSADLAVTKTDGVAFYTPGGTVTYTIRVSNNGPQTVIGATFADNLPAQIVSWTWTCVPDFSSTCTAGPIVSGANFTDTMNLAAGQGVTYTAVATINALASGNMVNTAAVTAPGAIPDPVGANNTATDTDSPPNADLAATINDGITIYTPGGTVTYTIVVSNLGPSNVTGATVNDPMPAQFTGWLWTCVADSGASCNPGPVGANPFTDTVNIPAGKKITYTVVASVNPAAVGDLVNTFTVTAPAGIPDPIPGNNVVVDTDVHPSADMAITITDMVVNYVAGGTVIYTITITNGGPSDVVGAAFADTAPAQVASWSWSCAPDLGATCTVGPFVGGALVTDLVNIPVGKRVIYTVVTTISGAAVGPMTNTVTITPPVAFPDPNMVNNSASDIDTP